MPTRVLFQHKHNFSAFTQLVKKTAFYEESNFF